jgi:hypothetical protein
MPDEGGIPGDQDLPIRKSDNPPEFMIDKVVYILKNCIGRREKLYKVADSLADTRANDTENHECDQEPEWPYELECV